MSLNPKKSQAVNDQILGVRRYKVRGQGVTCHGQQPGKWEEFVSLLVLCNVMFATSPLMLVMIGILSVQW